MKRLLASATFATALFAPLAPAGLEDLTNIFSEHSVDFKGTIYRQDIRNGNLRVIKSRISTKDLLRILEIELQTDFGKNPKLVVLERYTRDGNVWRTTVDDWNWCVSTRDGYVDVTDYFSYKPAPPENTSTQESGSKSTTTAHDEVFIGSDVLFFGFNGLASFTTTRSKFRTSNVGTVDVFQQDTSLKRVNGEAQTTNPPRIYPMDGSFTVKKGKVKARG